MGPSGCGKSTLAAALYHRGNDFVSDDLTVVSLDAELPMVYPGFPRIRLWPKTVTALGDDPAALPRIHGYSEKRLYPVRKGFVHGPRRLSRLYILEKGHGEEIEVLTREEGFLMLLKHSHSLRFIKSVEDNPWLMKQCACCADKSAIYRLRVPSSIPSPQSLAERVEAHLAIHA